MRAIALPIGLLIVSTTPWVASASEVAPHAASTRAEVTIDLAAFTKPHSHGRRARSPGGEWRNAPAMLGDGWFEAATATAPNVLNFDSYALIIPLTGLTGSNAPAPSLMPVYALDPRDLTTNIESGVIALAWDPATVDFVSSPTPFSTLAPYQPTYHNLVRTVNLTGPAPISSVDTYPVVAVYTGDVRQDGIVDVGTAFELFTVGPAAQQLLLGGSLAAAPGAQVGRTKLTQNGSPIPRDRVYVDYSHFDNTPLDSRGVGVNRVTPGFERTFRDGWCSIEVRAPFATTLDSDPVSGGVTNTSAAEFGNLTLFLKSLLWRNEHAAISGGLGIAAPTADDVVVRHVNGSEALRVTSEATHVLPFLGGVFAPNDRLFAQGLLQFDFDVSGATVQASDYVSGAPSGAMSTLGVAQDRDYVFVDLNVGWWAYRGFDRGARGWVRGVAPMVEYHLTQSLDGGDAIAGAAGTAAWSFAAPGSVSQSVAVIGTNVVLAHGATASIGYATPLGGEQQPFDGALRLTLSWLPAR